MLHRDALRNAGAGPTILNSSGKGLHLCIWFFQEYVEVLSELQIRFFFFIIIFLSTELWRVLMRSVLSSKSYLSNTCVD